MNSTKECAFCLKPASLMCSRCLEVYCSFECQIRDWSEHKKICVTVPKLYPNASYLDLLTGGVRLSQKGAAALIEQGSIQLVHNGSHPLDRKAIESVPVVERKTLASDLPRPTNDQDMSGIMVENVKRVSEMKIQEVVSQNGRILRCTGKPQTSAAIESAVNNQDNKVPAVKVPKPWMSPFPLGKVAGDVFEVVVQHVGTEQSPKLCWVVSLDHEPQCNQLLRDINARDHLRAEPIKYADVQMDDIYTGPYENVYYRMVILEKVDAERTLVRVRLIDYGNELTLSVSDLRAPLPQMKDLHAFAFPIEIQNLDHPLDTNEVIRVRLLRTEGDRMVVEMVHTSESLLSLLGNCQDSTGEGGIVAILSSRKALILLSCGKVLPIMKVLYTKLAEVAAMFPAANDSKVGDLVCVNSIDFGWSRALIIEQHDDYRLVYTVDNGAVELVWAQDVRTLPAKYKHKPRLVLAMEVTKVIMDEQEFKRMCYMPSFAFKFERLAFNQAQQTMKCSLKDGKGQRVAEIDLMDFECDLKKVGINYWPHSPQDKTIIRILSALDATTLVVCPKENINAYTELLKTVIPKLKRLTAAPNVKDTVVAVDDCSMPYRARVLSIVSPTEVEVLDLDSGKVSKTPLTQLYETSGFVNNLPVHTLKVRILDMIESAIKDQACILEQLDVFEREKREFKMHFEGKSYMHGVKLIDEGTNRSLANILMDHHDKKLRQLEEAATKKREQEQEAARLKAVAAAEAAAATAAAAKAAAAAAAAAEAAAAVSAKAEQERKAREVAILQMAKAATVPRIFTINDLEMVKLPVGKRGVKLIILDDSNLAHGVVTVLEFTDENIKRYTTLTDKVNEEAANVGGDGYCPKLDELCIAVFDDDKLWYRAVCLQAEPEKDAFMVQFIDFGNLATVKRKSIRSLPKQLDFPCAAHTCAVIDHTSVLKTLTAIQSSQGYVEALEIISDGEQYSLKF